MKKVFSKSPTIWLIAAMFAVVSVVCVQSQQFSPANTASNPIEPVADDNSVVIERGANHKVVQHLTWTTDDKGEAIAQTNSFTELATGLNYQNEKGEWEESREEIEILPNGAGAAARHGQHKVVFPPDIYDGQIEMQTSDGLWLRSRVLGLSYYDKESGNSVLIAEVTNSVGEVQGKNVVIYPEAFTDIRASLRLIYTKRGFEQDVVLLEQPPSPEKFGLNSETTRLQVLTEFFSPPQPAKREHMVTNTSGATIVVDEHLDFGALQMVPGKAFSVDQAETENKVPVSKQWLKLDGRDFLIEEVEVSAVAKELEALPKARSASLQSNTNAVRQARLGRPELPAKRLAAKTPGSKPMRMAQASSISKGFVMDYATINTGYSNYTFKGDTTYHISAPVTFTGTTTFEAGTVIKYAINASLVFGTTYLPNASINWQATAYRPVIFTAKDDNSVGETISGSTGNPAAGVYYANPALDIQNTYGIPSLQYVRFAHAQQAMTIGSSTYLNLSHAQFVKCNYGVGSGNYQSVYANLKNALFSYVVKPFNLTSLYYSGNISAQHVTFDNVTAMVAEGYATSYSLNLVNCILVNVLGTGWTGTASDHLNGNNNAFYATPFTFGSAIVPCTANPFQAPVGAGNYYLKANANGTDASGLRNTGTTSIDGSLLTELTRKTTFAPPPANVLLNVTINSTTPTVFSPTVQRDNDGSPDLGYHYEPLDYLCSQITIAAASAPLVLTNGVAVGLYGYSGFSLQGGAGSFSSQGRPDAMNRLAWYPSVQEQPVRLNNISTVSAAVFNLTSTSGAGSGGYPPKIVTLRFTDLPMMGFGQSLLGACYAYNNPVVTISDCWLRGVNFSVTETSYSPFAYPSPASITLKNNLFERGILRLYNGAFPYYQTINLPLGVTFYNNLFWSNTVALTYADANAYNHPAWTIKDNVYDGVTNTFSGSGSYASYIVNSHDAFRSTPNPLAGANHLTLTALTYATGPLGKWYINQASSASTPNTALENVGSRTASAAGLFHYTTTTAQQKEGFSTVDIGLHYVALDGNLATSQPLDADGDLAADYAEDANGNGIVDSPSEQSTPWFDTDGYWTDPFDLGTRGQAIHATLLPTGKVIVWPNANDYLVDYDPPPIGTTSTGTITPRAKPDFNTFCTGHTLMQDGSLFVAGGHWETPSGLRTMAAYSPLDDYWTRLPIMTTPRWYPSCITLDSGEILITGGTYGTGNSQMMIDDNNLPQVWNPTTGLFRDLTSALKKVRFYPYMFQHPGGGVFYAGPELLEETGDDRLKTLKLSTTTPGSWTDLGQLAEHREHSAPVMYEPGKILVAGGCGHWNSGLPEKSSEVIDLNLALPAIPEWADAQDMTYNRIHQNGTLLPDGTVLVTGGHQDPTATLDGYDPHPAIGDRKAFRYDPAVGGLVEVSVRTPELWGPDPLNPDQLSTDWVWTQMEKCPSYRGYHSTALLLPDGRVFSAGGNFPYPYNVPGAVWDGELFSPPYLFKGSRPSINETPKVVGYGETFTVKTPSTDTVQKVTLVRLGSVTHSFNANQRFLKPGFIRGTTTGGNTSWQVTAPPNAQECPPGHYMLFVINNVGVPSIAKIIQVLPASAPEIVMVCPANAGFVSPGDIKISAVVKNASDVASVKFYQNVGGNWTQIGSTVLNNQALDGNRHYSITWNQTVQAQYTIKATATKINNTQVDSAPFTFTVRSLPSYSSAMAFSPPVNGLAFGNEHYAVPVQVTADGTSSGSITMMEIYANRPVEAARAGVMVAQRTASPVSPMTTGFTWPFVQSGQNTLARLARDDVGIEQMMFGGSIQVFGGALDTTFNPSGTDGAPDGIVRTVAVQPDGKILVGGDFFVLGDIARPYVARLNVNGSLDNSFNTALGPNGPVHAIAIQPDGKVLIGGIFTSVNGTGRDRLARLNSDGSVDTGFNPGVSGGASPTVRSIVVQPDGKFIVGGAFTTVAGQTRNQIARFNSDGTIDTGFNPSFTGGSTPAVYSVALQTDGKVVVGGNFTTVGGQTRNRIARLDDNGNLDSLFNPVATPNDSVRSVAVQTDGKVVIGGDFTAVPFAFNRSYVARLNPNGNIDATFNANSVIGGTSPVVHSVIADQYGRVCIAGQFTSAHGNNLVRLAGNNGSLDTNFRPGPMTQISTLGLGADNTVRTLAMNPDGFLMLGGDFTTYKVPGEIPGIPPTPQPLSRGPHIVRVGGM